MTTLTFYLLALIALAIGTATMHMVLMKKIAVNSLYYYHFIGKPINWSPLVVLALWTSGI